jgi:hypothetical protein
MFKLLSFFSRAISLPHISKITSADCHFFPFFGKIFFNAALGGSFLEKLTKILLSENRKRENEKKNLSKKFLLKTVYKRKIL